MRTGARGLHAVYSIGEFSKITGLTVKTLRFYQEAGVLAPSMVDEETGYRYYNADRIEAARVVSRLRDLDFPLAEIAQIVRGPADEGDLLERLGRHKEAVRSKARHYREVEAEIVRIITTEREARTLMAQSTFAVEEKAVDSMLIAGVRMRGCYGDCGRGFAQIGRRYGRQICGKPFLLHYDTEYKADDADFEACMPIRRGAPADGISVRNYRVAAVWRSCTKGPMTSWAAPTRSSWPTSMNTAMRSACPAARSI